MKCLLGAVVVLLLSLSAFAADGQVLISQAVVNKAGGFPYQITQPGSYKLSGNLTVPANTDAISISADNVTIDLNGFSIVGPGTCSGAPVTSCTATAGSGISAPSTANGTTVRNGSVVGFRNGVMLPGRGVLVENVHVRYNLVGIFAGVYGTARLCSAVENYWGIRGVIVERNIATGNYYGVWANFGTALGNSATKNAIGLIVGYSTFGGNSMQMNTMNLDSSAGSTSQNTNNCDGSTC